MKRISTDWQSRSDNILNGSDDASGDRQVFGAKNSQFIHLKFAFICV